MEAYNNSIYPVFEADQVLSQKELNALVSHLEEQDRLTRKNLIGIGIVCGLDLDFTNSKTVTITCGSAVTSLGFQIEWKGGTFNKYRNYEVPDTFLQPDCTKEPYLKPIFDCAKQYDNIKNCIELLPNGSEGEGVLTITDDTFFEEKVILLLLEVTLIDQKNCVTTNCDDKGKRMEFNIRPLVISSVVAEEWMELYSQPKTYDKFSFPRYILDFSDTSTSIANTVLEQFKKVLTHPFLTSISTAIQTIYQDFENVLVENTGLTVLNNSKNNIKEIVEEYEDSVYIQYLWDWIFDIVSCYNDIVSFSEINPSLCCVNENAFPFHVALGGVTTEENLFRTPFIKTANATNEAYGKRKEVTLLFQRLALLITSFEVPKQNIIKVTPSTIGNVALSEKAIPFYYNGILDLNEKWHPKLTAKKQNDTILSYHAELPNYTTKNEVKKPLLYDIEPYNFFRIEGHIGMNYKKAIENLNLIKNSSALPFKITALNAVNFLNKEVDISKFDGRWDDLETDYDLARKRVYNITEFVIKWMDLRREVLDEKNIIKKQNIDNFKNILKQLKNLLSNDLKEFLPNYKSFYDIFKQLNYVFLFHRWCIQLQNQTLSTIAEDLIDRLDDINELFLEDPFTVIYEEAYLRWEKTYKDLFFTTFLKKYPGIEHKAGVAKGGTFVLVYVDTSIFKAAEPPLLYTNLLNTVTAYKKNIPIDDTIKDELISSVQFDDYKSQIKTKPKGLAIDKCKQESDNIKKELLDIVKYNLEATHTDEMKAYLLSNLKQVFEYEVGSTEEKISFQQTIIADFYLPYVCCGDGNTLEVKIEVNEPLTITLDASKYCNTDAGEKEIKIKGDSGGTFTGTAKDAIIQKSDKYYIQPNHPSIATPKSYNLQYEVNEASSNTIEFEIVSPEVLSWIPNRDSNKPNVFLFNNGNTNDTHDYEFDFGDNSPVITTNEMEIRHVFNFEEVHKSFTVTIKQLGEVCSNQQTIAVSALTNTTQGDFNKSDFNATDFNAN